MFYCFSYCSIEIYFNVFCGLFIGTGRTSSILIFWNVYQHHCLSYTRLQHARHIRYLCLCCSGIYVLYTACLQIKNLFPYQKPSTHPLQSWMYPILCLMHALCVKKRFYPFLNMLIRECVLIALNNTVIVSDSSACHVLLFLLTVLSY